MVSRRKILSRSRDDLNLDQTFTQQEEEEDVWYQKDKLYKEHIQEVLDKWTQIDDEIWAKVIVFERNRRVAKAYARAPVLTINGSDDGFDGMRIGLCGFDNPMRDQKTDELKRVIGQGVKIKMDDAGNILVRRYAKSNVFVKSTASNPNEETSIGAEILKLPNQALESEKIVKLFDMKKFQSNVNRELRRAYPDRRRLETQCLSAVAFVKSENDILECPIWVLIVNVVAMDMLKSKLPPVQRPIVDIKNRPRIPIPDEDPYSVAGNGSNGSSGSSGFGSGHQQQQQQLQQQHQQQQALGKHLNNGNNGHVAATREQLLLQTQQLAHKRSEKPPKLPPRDNVYAHDLIPKPDYDDIDLETRIKLSRGKSDKGKDNKKYDDPYYCGLRARVPNFVKSSKSGAKDQRDGNGNNIIMNGNGNSDGMSTLSQKKTSMIHNHMAGMHPHHIQQQQQQQLMAAAAAAAHAVHHQQPGHHQHQIWQTRSYESGIGIYKQGGYQPQLQQHQQQQHKTHALQLQMQMQQQQQQQPQSLPTDLTATTAITTKTQSTAKHHHNKARSNQQKQLQQQHQQQQQQQQQHLHSHLHPHSTAHGHAHHRHQQHHQHHHCHRLHHPPSHLPNKGAPNGGSYFPPAQYYDDLEEVAVRQGARRLSTRRTLLTTETACNCVSCYALAPLCGEVPAPRPQRSLSQQQLRRHQRLSGGLLDKHAGVAKWCSESDISVLEQVQEDEPIVHTDERYDSYEYDDFDMDFDIDDTNNTNTNNTNNGNGNSYMRQLQRLQRPRAVHSNEETDVYVDRAQLRQLTAPALLAARNKSQSTESFFEQPNEEGSLYMYGGRRRIVAKAPTALPVNIYERVPNSMSSDIGYKGGKLQPNSKRSQYYNSNNNKPQLPAPSWRGKRQQAATLLQKADKKLYDNTTNSNGNYNNKRQLTNNSSQNSNNSLSNNNNSNAKRNNDDVLKNKNNFNSKNKIITTATAATKSLAIATSAATAATPTATAAALASSATSTAAPAVGNGSATTVTSAATTNNALPQLQAQTQRTGRTASRLDISDMESIYGYLKPRKPRSLSLKKIQILDY
ncbi:hypothetical protein KR044_011849 [Drosophila immigrans]|nr:hypothetical protein KR044_011849 [Drosophila immigrans]